MTITNYIKERMNELRKTRVIKTESQLNDYTARMYELQAVLSKIEELGK